MIPMKKTYQGSCHCKAIQFECDLDFEVEPSRKCNCTYCFKTHYWKAFAKGKDFRLLKGEWHLHDYIPKHSNWPVGNIHHFSCSSCGANPFSRGYLEQFGGWFHAVNITCFDNVSEEEFSRIPVQYEDGIHDKYESPPEFTNYL